jgi:hypothetical protein
MAATSQRSLFDDQPKFGGETYDEARDGERLRGALARVYDLMRDGEWRTIAEIAAACECSEAGASARLMDLRKAWAKEKYPNRGVERQCIGAGLWQYRVLK